jgi:cell division protease FtsH
VLFELLNQMDGVEEDADIVFLLTTNRPDLLEPALAARPGRVDLAVEIPLPAAPERERLLALYSRGLESDVSDWSRIVDQTDGVTAAFLRELLRQAALAGASAGSATPPVLTVDAVLDVLVELTQAHQAMTTRLLGGRQPT